MGSFVPPQPELKRPLHRMNAAEWLMWTFLLPFVPIAWFIDRVRRR